MQINIDQSAHLTEKKETVLSVKVDYGLLNIQTEQKQLHWNPLEAVQITVSTCKKACPKKAADTMYGELYWAHSLGLYFIQI